MVSFSPKVCHPFTLRMVIWPDASRAQNSIAAVSAEGSTVWVLIRRLNSSCSRSMAFVVRAERHWLGGRRRKAGIAPFPWTVCGLADYGLAATSCMSAS